MNHSGNEMLCRMRRKVFNVYTLLPIEFDFLLSIESVLYGCSGYEVMECSKNQTVLETQPAFRTQVCIVDKMAWVRWEARSIRLVSIELF